MFNYFPRNTGSVQQFIAPQDGTYKIECWGASGKNDQETTIGYGGHGGYVKGNIKLVLNLKLYVYVGIQGLNNDISLTNAGGFSFGAGCGGGSSDIRLNNGDWNNFGSLKSRIIVAGGGGGAEGNGCDGGAGGGLNGLASINAKNAPNGPAPGATQTSGQGFGISIYPTSGYLWGGGGNGYYSGYSANRSGEDWTGGGGGSSFISGYPGCNAISELSTESNIVHTGSPNHYSGYIFTNPQMIDGVSSMPSPSGGTEIGHFGNGYCVISYIP